MVSIDLTPEDAEKFKQFCQYYDVFNTLLKSGVFTTKNGEVLIRFNHQSDLMSVNMHIEAYNKNHLKANKDLTIFG